MFGRKNHVQKIVGHGNGASIFGTERPPAGIRDRDADDLDRPAVCSDGVAPCCCKPGVDEAGDHVAVEPMGEHKQVLGDAVRNAGEQL